jgi:hypothetical protein
MCYNMCMESIWQLHIRQNKTFDDDHNEELRHASNRAHVLNFTVHGNMLLNSAAATRSVPPALSVPFVMVATTSAPQRRTGAGRYPIVN